MRQGSIKFTIYALNSLPRPKFVGSSRSHSATTDNMAAVPPSMEELEQGFASWSVECHPRAHPFILSKEEQNVGLEGLDLARLKCYYAALQLCLSDEYSFEYIKTTLESSSPEICKIVLDAWKALSTGTDQTDKLTELMEELFPPPPKVRFDVSKRPLYEELKQKVTLKRAEYGLYVFLDWLKKNDHTIELYSYYITLLSKKKLPEHELIKAYDEKSIFLKLMEKTIPQLQQALTSEKALLTLLSSFISPPSGEAPISSSEAPISPSGEASISPSREAPASSSGQEPTNSSSAAAPISPSGEALTSSPSVAAPIIPSDEALTSPSGEASTSSSSVAAPIIPSDEASNQFFDPQNALRCYCNYISQCIEMFASDPSYYSRYTTLCQSNGYGKTHISMEMSQKFFLIYSCLRKPGLEEAPLRSWIADYFGTIKSEAHFLLFYKSIFQVLNDTLLTEERIDELIGPRSTDSTYRKSGNMPLPSTGLHQIISNILMNEETSETIGSRFWQTVERTTQSMIVDGGLAATIETLQKDIETAFTNLQQRLEKRNLFRSFVFVIDEARYLFDHGVSGFRIWCHAISLISRKLPIFFLLVDSNSNIAHVTPVLERDPSKGVQSEGCKLFPPIYLVPFIDTVKLSKDHLHPPVFEAIIGEADAERYTPLKYNALIVLEKSRPVFLSRYQKWKDINWDLLYSRVVLTAQKKLTNSALLNEFQVIMEEESGRDVAVRAGASPTYLALQYMAILSCRLPLFPTQPTTNNTLVSNHMSTLLDMDVTREMITSCYVPEIILQEAAATFLRDSEYFSRSLEFLHQELRCKTFSMACSKEELGEAVVSMCMLRAFDCLVPLCMNRMRSDTFLTPRTTHAFFRSLLGQERFDALKLDKKLPCGYLSFTKWHRSEGGVGGYSLLHAFRWRCAIVCASGEAGFDLVIPCVKAGREQMLIEISSQGSSVLKLDENDLTGDDMFPIYIQVKNGTKPFTGASMKKAIVAINKANRLGPQFDQYFGIIFQVGKGGMGANHKKVFVKTGRTANSNRHFLMIPSVKSLTSDSTVFSKDIKKKLRSMAQMDRMRESKIAIKEKVAIFDETYYNFGRLTFSPWEIKATETEEKGPQRRDSMMEP